MPDDVRLVVADVDGTLVTPEKLLTPWARAVVRTIIEAGIAFTITSGRPPLRHEDVDRGASSRGSDHRIQRRAGRAARSLGHSRTPGPRLGRTASHRHLDEDTSSTSGCTATKDWYVMSRHGPHVDREEWTVKFPPTVVPTYEALLDRVVKIVGVSDDAEAMAALCHRGAATVRSTRVCGLVPTVLPGRDASEGQQGRSGQRPVGAAGHSHRTDRDHRGHAERCADVPSTAG